MYHWFKEARRAPGGDDMGGFTRILHSGKPDEFVDEIPTFVADPLADGDQVTAEQCCLCLTKLQSLSPCWIYVFLVWLSLLWFAVTGLLEFRRNVGCARK